MTRIESWLLCKRQFPKTTLKKGAFTTLVRQLGKVKKCIRLLIFFVQIVVFSD